jgi:hypothetical protein
MAIAKHSEPWMQTAEGALSERRLGTTLDTMDRPGRAARSELAMRNSMEELMRERHPGARMCHEMVMGEGKVRADLVAVAEAHIAAIEVKGAYDDTMRLLHQVGMYQLCVPEVWMVLDRKHRDDGVLIRHLLPSVGLIIADGTSHLSLDWRSDERPVSFDVLAEPAPREPVPRMTLEMLWAAELRWVCERMRIAIGSKATRPWMVEAILHSAKEGEIIAGACAVLRGRDAQWRADQPLSSNWSPGIK